MSTKATIEIIGNDHWYFELCTKYNHDIEAENDTSIVIKISPEYIVENDREGIVAVYPQGTKEYDQLRELLIVR